MAKFRSLYDEDVHVPMLGPGKVVKPGEVVDVPDAFAPNFEASTEGWESVFVLGSFNEKDGD